MPVFAAAEDCKRVYDEYQRCGNMVQTAKTLGIPRTTAISRYQIYLERFFDNRPKGPVSEIPKSRAKDIEYLHLPQGKTLVLSDIHIPYHDTESLLIALDAGANVIFGHFHRTQTYVHRALASIDDVRGSWAVGCLSGLYPQWLPMNNWTHGYAIVEHSDNGEFYVQNKKIIRGKIY